MKFNKKKLAAAIAILTAGSHAYAEDAQQNINLTITQIEGSKYQAVVTYQVSNSSPTTGLGLRLHYNSALVTNIQTVSYLTVGAVFSGSIAENNDTLDYDGSNTTDKYLLTAWGDISGNWPPTPNSLTTLYTFTFNLANPEEPTVLPFNFTSSSTPVGYILNATNQAVRLPDINVAPQGADKTITAEEDSTYTFSVDDFGFSDPDDDPANKFLAVKITSLPLLGTLKLGDTNVTAGQEIAVADISSLTFTPAANAHGDNYSALKFQVRDDGATTKAGSFDMDL